MLSGYPLLKEKEKTISASELDPGLAQEIISVGEWASRYDVRIRGGKGGPGKVDNVGRLLEFYSMNQFLLRTRGRGVKKSEKFADIIDVSPGGGRETERQERRDSEEVQKVRQ